MDADLVMRLKDAAIASGLNPERALAEAIALGECRPAPQLFFETCHSLLRANETNAMLACRCPRAGGCGPCSWPEYAE